MLRCTGRNQLMLLQTSNPLNAAPLIFPALECTHIIFCVIRRTSVYRNTALLDAAPKIPAPAKLAASLSLILWTSLVIAGRGIGYIEPPLDKIHARHFGAPAIALTAVPAERQF